MLLSASVIQKSCSLIVLTLGLCLVGRLGGNMATGVVEINPGGSGLTVTVMDSLGQGLCNAVEIQVDGMRITRRLEVLR